MNLLICDDHKIVRDGIKQILYQTEPSFVIEEANDGAEAIKMARNKTYDLILLDISLPDRNGLDILKTIKSKSPSTRVLILSMHHQDQYVKRAIKLGASGYLTKDVASEELIHAIVSINNGKKYISRSLAENFVLNLFETEDSPEKPKHEYLSGREFEIMLLIANGRSLMDIGNELFISVKTVSTYRSRIMGKMGMTKNAELTIYCLKTGLI